MSVMFKYSLDPKKNYPPEVYLLRTAFSLTLSKAVEIADKYDIAYVLEEAE